MDLQSPELGEVDSHIFQSFVVHFQFCVSLHLTSFQIRTQELQAGQARKVVGDVYPILNSTIAQRRPWESKTTEVFTTTDSFKYTGDIVELVYTAEP